MNDRPWLPLLAATVLATACASSPAPTTSTAAVSTPGSTTGSAVLPELTETFESPWYGYSVDYPGGWTPVVGKGPWAPGEVLFHGDPRLDAIQGSTASGPVRFVGASQQLPDGTTLKRFAGSAGPFTCPPGDRLPEPITIDGAAALVTLDGCPSEAELGGRIWDVVVIRGGRGYDFTVDGEIDVSDVATWLASVTLEPSSARP